MSTKRTRNATTDPSWQEQAKATIKTGDIAKVQHIMNELRILTTFGQSRLDSLTAQIGTGVVLVNSKYINSSDISDIDRDTSDKEVRGEFTAGPNRHPFDIVLLTEHCGDTNITLTGPCFEIRDDEPDQYNFFDDDDIEEFLMNAGLEDAQPERAPTDDDMTPKTRRRWVLGDVIHDAIELLEVKYDGEVDMEQDIAYQWMELEDGEWLQNKRCQEEWKKAHAA